MHTPHQERTRRLICRWCGWSTLGMYTDKRGRRRSGWGKLHAHVDHAHKDEAQAIDRAGEELDEGILQAQGETQMFQDEVSGIDLDVRSW